MFITICIIISYSHTTKYVAVFLIFIICLKDSEIIYTKHLYKQFMLHYSLPLNILYTI